MNQNNIEGVFIILISILALLLAVKFLFSSFGKEGKKLGNEIFKIGGISEIVLFLFLISPIISSVLALLIIAVGIFLYYKKKKNSRKKK
jgi:uncharacterized membrane protein